MKIQITYKIHYLDRTILKIVNIDNCIDKAHAKERFNLWANIKFKNAIKIEIEDIKEMDVSLEYLKKMFNMD